MEMSLFQNFSKLDLKSLYDQNALYNATLDDKDLVIHALKWS